MTKPLRLARHRRSLSALVLALAAALGASSVRAQNADSLALPPVRRELRAAWIATVANIDWPSRPGLPADAQQREMLAILDRAAALRLNAIVFQVRPAADAFYASSIEPWSYFLTGAQGRPPSPYYDPLAFVVKEAHARGIAVHAWFNPFRARYSQRELPAAPSHVSRRAPSLVKPYGPYLWMDPGDPRARALALRVVRDVVKRYDVDAVHIDDYFYPYQERDRRGRYIPFPDDATWRRYRKGRGRLTRDDWRRRNVDTFVRELHAAVRATRRDVLVGISPFGIWRPGNPAGVAGLDAYQELWADSRLWLREGWVDYWVPQLYWRADAPQQRFASLLAWWSAENVKGRHLWPGLFTSRVAGDEPANRWTAGEILRQVGLTRAEAGAGGDIHFSMQALMANRDGLADSLVVGPYAEPALQPRTPWLDSVPPARPRAAARVDSAGRWTIRATPAAGERPWLWLVRVRMAGAWRTELVPAVDGRELVFPLPAGAPSIVAVAAVDRLGNESASAIVRP